MELSFTDLQLVDLKNSITDRGIGHVLEELNHFSKQMHKEFLH